MTRRSPYRAEPRKNGRKEAWQRKLESERG
jgi:hypothetical protein